LPKSRVRCPRCGEVSGVPILWGMPDNDASERAERGEVVLGGCLVTDDDPDWSCTNPACGNEWMDV